MSQYACLAYLALIFPFALAAQVSEFNQIRLDSVAVDEAADEVLLIDSTGLIVKRSIEGAGIPTGALMLSDNASDPLLLSSGYRQYGAVFADIGLTPTDGSRFGTWTSMALQITNRRRAQHSATWTDDGMLIFGGRDINRINDPLFYRLSSDSWEPVSTVDMPSPRQGHSTIGRGTSAYIYGGFGPDMPTTETNLYRYHTPTNTWFPLASYGGRRSNQSMVLMDDGRMIMWGGETSSLSYFNDGAIYDPDTDTWSPIADAPLIGRSLHKAIWSEINGKMYVFGGISYGGTNLLPMSYDPNTDTWEIIPKPTGYNGRIYHTTVFNGRYIYIYGGTNDVAVVQDDWEYDVLSSADPWTRLTEENSPQQRQYHTAVSTPYGMIIWGGSFTSGVPVGKRFNYGCRCWQDISTISEPTPRIHHSAVWTGSRMIIWGGDGVFSPVGRRNDGAVYDPSEIGVGPLEYGPLFLYKKS